MNRKNAALALLLAFALPATALRGAEDKPLPKELPPFGPDKPLPVPAIQKSSTPEGLTIWLVKRPGFPKVAAALVVRGGTAADPAGMEGVSELLSDTLKEGTAKRSSRQIAEELQAIGGELSTSASDDAIFVTSNALSTGTSKLLDVLADVARNAAFPASEVQLAKGNALQNLAARESTPEFLAQKAFASAVYGTHPYHVVSPTREVIGKVTPEILRKEFVRRFRPDHALLVLVGDIDDGALNAVETAFKGWRGTGEAAPGTPPSPKARGRELYFVDRPGSVQSLLMVGRPAPKATDADYYPTIVANTVFGGAFGSRLVLNVREDKGYSYSPGASVLTNQEGGLLRVRADVRNEVTAASLLEIFYELDRMAATSPTADELTKAKRFQTGLYLLRNQIQGAVAGTLASNWVKGLPPEELGLFVTKVNAVTARQIEDAGRATFRSDTQTVVVVGDAKKVKGDVEVFGPVRDLAP